MFLSRKDTSRLEKALNVDHDEFVDTYCRWVPSTNGKKLSLKETVNFDCIFWSLQEGGGCAVYNDRPLQCRAFPFWDSILSSPGAWKTASKDCPGMNRGDLHTGMSIKKWLDRREAEPHILKKADKAREG